MTSAAFGRMVVRLVSTLALGCALCLFGLGCTSANSGGSAPIETEPAPKPPGSTAAVVDPIISPAAASVCGAYVQLMLYDELPEVGDEGKQYYVLHGLERIRADHESDLRSEPVLRGYLDAAIVEQSNTATRQGSIPAFRRLIEACGDYINQPPPTTR